MRNFPDWYYDEFQQVGLDFEDSSRVALYERHQGSDAAAERALIERLGIGPDDVVIDLGCGTGSFARAAALSCKQVHAVDVSRAMLDDLRAAAEAAALANMAFHHAGFLTYAHAGAAADAVVTRSALHHLPDFWKMVALTRVGAMLRTGGTLYLEDVVFSFAPADYAAGVDGWIAQIAKPKGEGFTADDFATHVREEYTTYGWILEGMLERAGFRIVDADITAPAYAAYTCTKIDIREPVTRV